MDNRYCGGCNKGCNNNYGSAATPSPNDAYLNHSHSDPQFESGLEQEAQSGTIESARRDAGMGNASITGTNYEAGTSDVYGSVTMINNYGTIELNEQESKEREITDLLEADRETNAQFRETVATDSDSNTSYTTSFNQNVQQDFDLEGSVNLLKRFGYEEEE